MFESLQERTRGAEDRRSDRDLKETEALMRQGGRNV
jgi:hypothetical protein